MSVVLEASSLMGWVHHSPEHRLNIEGQKSSLIIQRQIRMHLTLKKNIPIMSNGLAEIN